MLTGKRAFLYLLIGTVMLTFIGCLNGKRAVKGKLVIARDGKAAVCIVKPSDPIPAETRAVKELADYLTKVTGAAFQVIDEKDASRKIPAIYVGPTAFAKKQGIDVDKLGEEESIIRTVGKNLIVTGGRPRGTLYGVYIFLEDALGVRWYTPWFEQVPSQAACSIGGMDIQRKPYFNYREHYGAPVDWIHTYLKGSEQWKWWSVRNRISLVASEVTFSRNPWYASLFEEMGKGWLCVGNASHSFMQLVSEEEYFSEHPEYFSMRNGKRVAGYTDANGKKVGFGESGNQLCLMNKDVQRIVQDKVFERFRKYPLANWTSISPNDGGCATFCDCPECRAFVEKNGTEADLYLHFVNPIAEAVEKEFPGKKIVTMFGYQPARTPPKTLKPRDNIINRTGYWPGVFKQSWTFAHWNGYLAPFMCVMPCWWTGIDGDIKDSKKKSFSGYFAEHELVIRDPIIQELYEMQAWLFAKLTEDPDRDVDKLMSDFVHGYFGEAGPFIFEYIMLQKERYPLWPWRMINYAFLNKAQTLFDKAEAAVEKKPELLARVKDLRINLDMASLIIRNNVMGDYVRQGNKLEDYPYKRDLLRKRLLERFGQVTNAYWLTKTDFSAANKTTRNITAVETLKPLVEMLGSGGAEYAPLPDRAREVPFEQILDVPVGAFTTMNKEFTPDPEAVLGVARRLPANAEQVLLSIGARDIKRDGKFHLYKICRCLAKSTRALYLLTRWGAGVTIPYDPGKTNQVWECYFSLKTTGADKSKEPDLILVDRVVFVNIGDLEELRAKGEDVPAIPPGAFEFLK